MNNDINNCQIKIIYEFLSNTHVQTETIIDKNCIGKILFYPDLQNWDTIKNYTYREYLHKQLEMYNFTQEESE